VDPRPDKTLLGCDGAGAVEGTTSDRELVVEEKLDRCPAVGTPYG